jgi:hypothetical protein
MHAPDPSAIAIWATLAEIFRRVAHHLEYQLAGGIFVIVGRD